MQPQVVDESLGQPRANPLPAKSRSHLLFTLFFLLSVLYLAKDLNRGWLPMDDGTLGLSADYVLQGELPHRDYFEGYTGGLTYLNALAFRVFGPESMSMRYMLFLFILAWVPAVYYVASRFVPAIAAGPLTFLAAAWVIPNYPMPSWYNLFCATFGLAALLRYIEVERARWLVVAGLFGGASFLFKQTGIFFIAGVILFLLFREQIANTQLAGIEERSGDRQSRLYGIFLCAALLIFTTALFDLIVKRLGVINLCYFFLPAALLGVPILWLEYRPTANRSHRFKFLFRELAFFIAGVALPILIFLVPFIRSGALADFVREVFTAPSTQIARVATTPTLLKFAGGVVVNAILVFGMFLARPQLKKFISRLALLVMAVGLVLARPLPAVYKAIFATVWVLLPALVVCGSILIVRRLRSRDRTEISQQRLFLMLCITALCSLVQFPTTAGIYFCYAAPLAVLAAAAVISCVDDRPPRWFLVGSYCFALFYVVFVVTPGHVLNVLDIGSIYSADTQTSPLNLPRVRGIRTYPVQAQVYETLNGIIRQHARGQYIFATPDSAEIYYFSGFRSPTRYFFDLWDAAPGRTQRVLNTVHARAINLVILNNSATTPSGPVSSELRTAFEKEFPNHAVAGNFEVRWKP
jgi:Dolichyl-phosphate-mannose-protein mannosyltransferase